MSTEPTARRDLPPPTTTAPGLPASGSASQVSVVDVRGHTLVTAGRWIRVACVKDEHFAQGDAVKDVDALTAALQGSDRRADVLTLVQRPLDAELRLAHHVEWKNHAAIPITTYEAWWKSLPRNTRSNVTRAAKRGVQIRIVAFDDELARGIHRLWNDKPTRQGRRFLHYGKSLDQVRHEHATYPDRSVFIGAFHEGQLIGYLRLVFTNGTATIKNILGLDAQRDKRPMNALLAKAVAVCTEQGASHLVYGELEYGNKRNCPLAEFKRRNGFQKLAFPRYYVPLTRLGRLYVALRLYRGAIGMVPGELLDMSLRLRRYLRDRTAALPARSTQP